MGVPAIGARSKSRDEFATADAPHIDFVFAVGDSAAGELCPVWPGKPMTAHWGLPDPAAVQGSEEVVKLAFHAAAVTSKRRIDWLLALPLNTLDAMATQHELHDIGSR